LDPSNLRAISRGTTPDRVGWATLATFSSPFRPSLLPISASVDLSGSDSLRWAGSVIARSGSRPPVFVLPQQLLVYQTCYIGNNRAHFCFAW